MSINILAKAKPVLLATTIGFLTLGSHPSFAGASPRACTPSNVAGAYIHQRNDQFIEQIELHDDGTAAWFQSTQFDHLVTIGSVARGVGTWKCADATSVVLTVISPVYVSEAVPDPIHDGELTSDLAYDSLQRLTVRFRVVNRTTLERNYFTYRIFAPGDDPMSPSSVPLYDPVTSDVLRTYKKVPVVTSDLP